MRDDEYMRLAIQVGEKARLLAPPNPWVGCVLVKNGKVIAEGFTQPPGCAHAEVKTLELAGTAAEGATAYITLEPCAHYGRTPPCTRALRQAKIARVVIALQDPDPLVSGKGIEELRQTGVEVEVGVCAQEAELSLLPYLHHRRTGKAYCLLKTAVSIDGRVAARDGTSQWITGAEARMDAHRLRAQSQAIMIGSGTALKDLPALTVREGPFPSRLPLRILYDRRGRVPAKGPLFDVSLASTLVITTSLSGQARQEEWRDAGASVAVFEEETSFESILSNLGAQGIIQLMVEGGSTLQGAILRQGACQALVVYGGPVILGDQGLPAFLDLPVGTLEEAAALTLHSTKMLGQSTRTDYFITSGAS